MVIGKTEHAVNNLMIQFRDRVVSKRYLALVSGIPKKRRGEIDAPLGRSSHDRKMFAVREDGKQSITRYRVITSYRENCALVDITLLTGRTHQIRVHFKHIGHPLLGDKVYAGKNAGPRERYPRQMLHAARLTFLHPETGNELVFGAPLPDDFAQAIEHLTPLESPGTT
jgi:23S rRNA pseudouridine1911/1915/1917 synthase